MHCPVWFAADKPVNNLFDPPAALCIVMPQNVFHMPETLLQRYHLDSKIITILYETDNLRFAVSIAIGNQRMFFEGVGSLPFHDQRINSITAQPAGKILQRGHWHDLYPQVQMKTTHLEGFFGGQRSL